LGTYWSLLLLAACDVDLLAAAAWWTVVFVSVGTILLGVGGRILVARRLAHRNAQPS